MKSTTLKSVTLTGALFVAAGAAASQVQAQHGAAAGGDKPHVIIATPGAVKWGPAPAILPAGAQLAVLEGDPSKAEPFTMRLSLPDGYRIPPHFHPVVEHVTVIQGAFLVGMGERFDAAKLAELPTGSFAAMEPGMRHFAQARGATIVQLHGVGPWSLTYVNPADDPRARPR